MMLEHLGEEKGAKLVDEAITKLLSSGRIKDLSTKSGLKTYEIGDMVVRNMGLS